MQSELNFREVDGLSFAASEGRLNPSMFDSLVVVNLGPLVETVHLSLDGLLPTLPRICLATKTVNELLDAIHRSKDYWNVSKQCEAVGMIRVKEPSESYDLCLTDFLLRAKTAGQRVSGLPRAVAGMLAAAIVELENNITEHAHAQNSGLLIFRAKRGLFEFVASDRGIGILKSLLSKGKNLDVSDEGTALSSALTEGVSCRGRDIGHGYGFKQLFQGLIDQFGELRFRSGGYALTIEGQSPELASARVAQKCKLKGFFASVRCVAPIDDHSKSDLS